LIVFLITGSNIGDSTANLQQALMKIEGLIGTVLATSSLYKSAPWGNTNQRDFVNQVLQVKTNLSADKLLKAILEIEIEMGRIRNLKWEPRVIDIDILLYENLILESDTLTLPHPHLHERNFVLTPLAELAPDFIHPVLHQSIAQLLLHSADKGLVEKM
jgi:2-amino-4-hydroxy-6-hydroxymethyldihydropteridine diphosphokinase